eukprot:9172815-Pyramimonas_sp.AAC.1
MDARAEDSAMPSGPDAINDDDAPKWLRAFAGFDKLANDASEAKRTAHEALQATANMSDKMDESEVEKELKAAVQEAVEAHSHGKPTTQTPTPTGALDI